MSHRQDLFDEKIIEKLQIFRVESNLIFID